jgi:hypothetical protein
MPPSLTFPALFHATIAYAQAALESCADQVGLRIAQHGSAPHVGQLAQSFMAAPDVRRIKRMCPSSSLARSVIQY